MSLEEQATLIRTKLNNINLKVNEGMDLCNRVLEQVNLNGETAEWTATQKQKFIDRGLSLIAEIKTLVEALP